MNRALPNWAIDMIRDGARPADLRREGERAVWRALVRTACSAVQRGWSYAEWAGELDSPKSHLGTQAKLKRGRTPRNRRDYEETLHGAWTAAGKWAERADDPSRVETAIAERITATRTLAGDADATLTDAERAILCHAATVAERNRTDRPALPRRATADTLGLGERTVRDTLAALVRRDLLTLAVRGQAARTAKFQRANLYRLPTPAAVHTYLYRETRSMGRSAQVYGTPAVRPAGTSAQVYGTTDPPDEEGSPMITVTRDPDGRLILSAPPDVLERAVAAMQSDGRLVVANEHAADNVRTLRPREPRSA